MAVTDKPLGPRKLIRPVCRGAARINAQVAMPAIRAPKPASQRPDRCQGPKSVQSPNRGRSPGRPIVGIEEKREERASPPSSRRLVTRADVGATPAQGVVIPKPRPTAWVWERIRRGGLKGRDTLDVESSTTSSRSGMRQRSVVRGHIIAPRWGALSGKGSAYPGRWPGLRDHGPLARPSAAPTRHRDNGP
jgi:hypothetical protein